MTIKNKFFIKLFQIVLIIVIILLLTLVFIAKPIENDEDAFHEDITFVEKNGVLSFSNHMSGITFYLDDGNYDVSFNDTTNITKAYFETVINDVQCSSLDSVFNYYKLYDINDDFGKGKKLSVFTTFENLEISLSFKLYEQYPYTIIETSAISPDTLKSNYFRHVYHDKKTAFSTFKNMTNLKFLEVPFDNDSYEEFDPVFLGFWGDFKGHYGYEVSMLFEEESKNCMVFGSLDHDAFKSALYAKAKLTNSTKKISRLEEFYFQNGVCTDDTRDITDGITHGYVYGKTINFPQLFIGYYDDYRDGLEAYGDASKIINPPLEWNLGTPIGYNSWAAQGSKVTYAEMIRVSDFMKNSLQEYNYDGISYINFDSFWDHITDEEVIEVVKYANANGQKVGSYMCPFNYWGDNLDQVVDGTNGMYTYGDILKRDKNGQPLKEFYCYSLDPTHPGTLMNIKYQLDKKIEAGYEYIKMDFLMHGSFEAEHYDKSITTGIMAYNFGMKFIMDYIMENSPKPMFINIAMSPIFPNQYVHSRRISCDVFHSMSAKEYMLNSHSFGWWMNGRLYAYNDPDHIVFYKSFNSNDLASYNEAVATINSAIMAGTVLMWSDKTIYPEATSRAVEFLNNKELMDIAKLGKAFRPVFTNKTSPAYYLIDDDYVYVGLFNFSRSDKTINISFEELGIKANQIRAKNLNSGQYYDMNDKLSYTLTPKTSAMLKIPRL